MLVRDFAPLIDRVRGRFLAWTSKQLSYAGRLQLIKSVITSICNFWCSVFRLPAKCFDSIEQMCGRFLWTGSPNTHSTAKVSWAEVSTPQIEGGLGLRKLRDMSRVFALSLIWSLFTSSGSLWVPWCRRHLLRKCSFWSAPATTLGSWIWRKLLKLRELASTFLCVQVRDGKSCSFWHDNWLPLGRLIDITGTLGPSLLGIPLNATVAEAATPSGWKLRLTRGRRFNNLRELIHSHALPDATKGPDVFLWRQDSDTFKPIFSSNLTWQQLRSRQPGVSWHRDVWFKQSIPRCSFIVWLAVKDRLSTGSRMRMWGLAQHCVFCGERDETRDHLFFACPYSFTIWSEVAGKILGPRIKPDWSTTLASSAFTTSTNHKRLLLRLALHVTIYLVWQERNGRLHGQAHRPVSTLTRLIDKMVRNRITSLDYRRNNGYNYLLQHWFDSR